MAELDLLPPERPVDLSSCDREPIHTPGAIQPHGRLIVADAASLAITHVSANLDPGLLGAPIEKRLPPELIAAALAQSTHDAYAPGRILAAAPPGEAGEWDLTVHRSGGALYFEFEPGGDPRERQSLLLRAQGVLQALRGAGTLGRLLDAAAAELKGLTGFDRVMVYRFGRDGHGEVVAESHAPGQEAYLGLHYPAGDVPRQARRLYLLQRVRGIADVDYRPVPVLAAEGDGPAWDLDMSLCHLRSVSPIHLEYMRNMGVAGTFAVSLIQDGALWGMLICHHRTPRRLSAAVRALCDLIGQVLSVLIGEKEQAGALKDRLARQELLSGLEPALAGADHLADALAGEAALLLRLAGADGARIELGGETRLIGVTPPPPLAHRIAAAMLARSLGETVVSESVGTDYPELGAVPEAGAGAMTVPILQGPGDAITWFRGEARRHVSWGGNPDKPVDIGADGRLNPRKSFAAWRQLVEGRSLAWEAGDLAAADDLRRLVTTARLRQAEARLAAEQSANERLRAVLGQIFAFVAILDRDGGLIEANAQPAGLAASAPGLVRGEPFWQVDWWAADAGERGRLREAVAAAGRGETRRFDVAIDRPGSGVTTIDFQVAPLVDGEGRISHLVASGVDISARRAAQCALETALANRDLLLYEVNHRVKNSLQLVTSILALEAGKIADPAARASVMDARAKITHIAQLHQRLYTCGSHDKVDFAAFLRDMGGSMLASAGRSGSVTLVFEGPAEAPLGIRLAAPLALIAGELITNALKHGFPERDGRLTVTFVLDADTARLKICDDGVGLPEGFDPARSLSIGMKVVLGLVAQLRGRLDVGHHGPGACFTVTVPIEEGQA
jgi:light-regulated signal transduction histidine kinase (bacteriophytochrome)